MADIESDLSSKKLELENYPSEISNHKESIQKCVEVSQNISKYWAKSNIELKLIIQNLVFPSGTIIDGEKRRYLTQEVNQIFSFEQDITSDTGGPKKGSVALTTGNFKKDILDSKLSHYVQASSLSESDHFTSGLPQVTIQSQLSRCGGIDGNSWGKSGSFDITTLGF